MSDNTKIEWADATVNAVNGCSVLSPGCINCYAMRLAGTRLKHHPSRAGLTRDVKGKPVWTGEVRLNETALLQPLRWKRPRRIFWNAHGDLFHENVPDAWIDRVFAVCALTPQHTHMILTKRGARMRAYVGSLDRAIVKAFTPPHQHPTLDDRHAEFFAVIAPNPIAAWPLPNVWLGVSVEDQTRADERIPDLLATPAAIRFISAEPLLGPVDLCNTDFRPSKLGCGTVDSLDPEFAPAIDWVICGGESGPPHARPMHPDWARSLRDQCAAAGVAFHFKQWGEWGPDVGPLETRDRDGVRHDPVMEGLGPCRVLVDGAWQEFGSGYAVPIELCSGHGEHVYRWGKKRAGRLLDGVTHDGFPT